MDIAEFHEAVYQTVRQIPFGRVTSYGHIAKLIGLPRHSRHVGQALKYLNVDADVPWQRVVSSSGKISSRGPGTSGAQRQREALEGEGVEVRVMRDGGLAVNFSECGWFPERVGAEEEVATETVGTTGVEGENQDAGQPQE
ncbi:hypothetical protein M0805_000062 [Coniferiporia weirii]|nr:hypothetical protein M0805_000062 [Coniferiporia weirii]